MLYNVFDLDSQVKKAARFVSFQWPGVMEAEDAEQGIYLRLLESPGSVKKILEMDQKAQYRAIVGIGNQLASEERTDYQYYSGSFRYGVAEVKQLLNKGALVNDRTRFSSELVDLDEAMSVLLKKSPQYVDAIRRRYRDGETTEDDKRFEDALRRGLGSLTDEMNRSHRNRHAERTSGPALRKPVKSYDAQETTDSDWDGEYVFD